MAIFYGQQGENGPILLKSTREYHFCGISLNIPGSIGNLEMIFILTMMHIGAIYFSFPTPSTQIINEAT